VILSAISIVLVFGILNMQNDKIFALTESQRYNQGYSWGCSDARQGGHPYLNSHPSHSPIFMSGYQQGYAACSSSHTPSPSTTVTVNRNNMFTDQNMCKAVQTYLMLSCSAYVKSNGVLTAKGQVAKSCIANGVILTGAGYLLSHGTIATLGTGPIINILKPLSEATGCGGIVNWQKLSQDADGATAFLGLLGIH
jgi:hypothetical protein